MKMLVQLSHLQYFLQPIPFWFFLFYGAQAFCISSHEMSIWKHMFHQSTVWFSPDFILHILSWEDWTSLRPLFPVFQLSTRLKRSNSIFAVHFLSFHSHQAVFYMPDQIAILIFSPLFSVAVIVACTIANHTPIAGKSNSTDIHDYFMPGTFTKTGTKSWPYLCRRSKKFVNMNSPAL